MTDADVLRERADLVWRTYKSDELNDIYGAMYKAAEDGCYFILLNKEVDDRVVYYLMRQGLTVERSYVVGSGKSTIREISWWKDPSVRNEVSE